MKILFNNYFKTILGIGMTTGALMFAQPVAVQNTHKKQTIDSFVMHNNVPPQGTTDLYILRNAPNNQLSIQGKIKNAVFVVDITQNVLYHYDDHGFPMAAYSVASGKKSSPTETGVRVVTHVESYPYRSAGKNTKRRRNPRDYGPNVICVEKLDPRNGARSVTGQFIHGNNNFSSLGKYVSLGCIRMDNEVIKKLAKVVKRGSIILIKR